MKETLKTLLMVAIVPALLALEVVTGHVGFYNVAAFIIVVLTAFMAMAIGLLFWHIHRPQFDPMKMKPTIPNKKLMWFSRCVSILTTIYLVWAGHLFVAFIDLLNLILSFVALALIKVIADAITECENESPIARTLRELDEFQARQRTSKHL